MPPLALVKLRRRRAHAILAGLRAATAPRRVAMALLYKATIFLRMG